LKLHIGCGRKIKVGWINIDFSAQADISLYMRESLPFQDNSCSVIYPEHFLEHLEYPRKVIPFLMECFRVLKPKGIFSVGVPDTEWPIKEYLGLGNKNYFEIAEKCLHPEWCKTEMEHINYHFREDYEHLFAYDFKTLAKSLESVGFQKIQRRDFDPELDSEDRKLGTLYVNCSKLKQK
jgi:predicted SAM-dependent methyltransferase